MIAGVNDTQPSVPNGIDGPAVTAWFQEHVPGVVPPLRFTQVAGGHSNITCRVDDAAGGSWVIRRPPLGHVLATAHDMGREWRAIHALQGTGVPVPPSIAFEPASEVTGAPFYVMGYVPGNVLHNAELTERAVAEERRREVAWSLIDSLAALHAVDVDAVGLGEHGPRDGYIERQLKRWYRQYQQSAYREVPDVDRAYEILSASVPAQVGPATVVHGDYRLGNCITGFDHRIAAILDWEISTLGDPLADVGYLLSTWIRPSDSSAGQGHSATTPSLLAGFPERHELAARYAEASGRDVSRIAWYQAFNHWKGAAIVQGVVARYRGGALGDTSHLDLDAFDRSVEIQSRAALVALGAA
jgi:aminoglycoside phosphotransferase (APT) family kinase protein